MLRLFTVGDQRRNQSIPQSDVFRHDVFPRRRFYRYWVFAPAVFKKPTNSAAAPVPIVPSSNSRCMDGSNRSRILLANIQLLGVAKALSVDSGLKLKQELAPSPGQESDDVGIDSFVLRPFEPVVQIVFEVDVGKPVPQSR